MGEGGGAERQWRRQAGKRRATHPYRVAALTGSEDAGAGAPFSLSLYVHTVATQTPAGFSSR